MAKRRGGRRGGGGGAAGGGPAQEEASSIMDQLLASAGKLDHVDGEELQDWLLPGRWQLAH